tara:strand:- start:193 stop:369 length:177 start_codon:yes stop_codon:yes gene_type:complete
MLNLEKDSSVQTLTMNTEAHYRQQADSYRSSPAYKEMKQLYPMLQTYIEYCRDEQLIA